MTHWEVQQGIIRGMKTTYGRSRTHKRVRLIVEGEGLEFEGLDPVGGTLRFTRIKYVYEKAFRGRIVPLIREAILT